MTAYTFEHTVECRVGRDFARRFWSDVGNWAAVDSSVESVALEGPFAAGTRGRTKPRGAEAVGWSLAEVRDGEGAVVEASVPGAVLRFSWAFADAPGGGTLITQRLSLEGERAEDYLGAMEEFERGIPEGMRSLARAMEEAASA